MVLRVKKNKVEQSQPLALVAFRKQIHQNEFSDEIVFREIPAILLGQLRIGSLCENNRVIALADFQVKKFDLQYQKGGWWFTSFYQTTKKNWSAPYPQEIYPLLYANDKSLMIEFRLEKGGRLLIPTLEFFTRCYGRSGELRRILMTYPWEMPGGCLDRFYAPLERPEKPNLWQIRLGKRLYNDDAIFLAHVKYDDYTRKAAKTIYSYLEKGFSNTNDSISPFIGPWYIGKAQLLVKGISFNEGRSFLGLQISGLSEPEGKEIESCRDNRNNAAEPAENGGDRDVWEGVKGEQINHIDENVSITGIESPDRGSDIFELEDPALVIIGTRRKVRSYKDVQAKSSRGRVGSDEDEVDKLSAGEVYGDGKGVGQASIHTKALMESEGALRDIWNAVLYLKQHYQDIVGSVAWYTPEKGYVESEEPELIALDPFDVDDAFKGDSIPTSMRKWPFMDIRTLSEPRGILVIKINILGTIVHIVEIQRRPKNVKNRNTGVTIKSEESFCGLVFMLENQANFDSWLHFIRTNVRKVEGVVSNLTRYCPGKADFFKHSASAGESVPCFSALRNALNKMDISVS